MTEADTKRTPSPVITALLVGILIGFTSFVGIRYLFKTTLATHFHANVAVFVDGKREEFKSPTFYEEAQSCVTRQHNPKGRVHMHQPDYNVVHIHDENVTWGNLFENIGWSIGPNFLATELQTYQTTKTKELVFVLNGQKLANPAGEIINDKDVLLVSYGSKEADLTDQLLQVTQPTTAETANQRNDPAACQGSSSEDQSFAERLKQAIW